VLDALLEHGHAIPHNCRIGVCQSCLMRAVAGDIPAEAQQGLRDTLKAQHYFLACQCVPVTSLEVTLPVPDSLRTAVKVVTSERLRPDVLQLRLKPEGTFDYQAGQYAMLWNSQQLGRCYSLASVPDLDDFLELHVARVSGGRMSAWLFDGLKPGDQLQLQAASGNCFYVTGRPEQNILLAGTGTGLAPLWGIARDALHKGHRGEIHLIHGAIHAHGLYMHDKLQELARNYDNFFYHASILEGASNHEEVTVGSIEALVTQVVPNPKDWKVYLCGAEALVNTLKKKIFLAGASMANIYSDPFVRASDTSNAT
jgi:CDP-4-dehydro-6-deoxyglucose reductase